MHYSPCARASDKVPSLQAATPLDLAFLWEATLQGAADLQYHYLNGLEYTNEDLRSQTYSFPSINALRKGTR